MDPRSVGDEVRIVKNYYLYQNYPNPFNPSTRISFQVPLLSKVQIVVFNSTGEQVSELVNEVRNAGG